MIVNDKQQGFKLSGQRSEVLKSSAAHFGLRVVVVAGCCKIRNALSRCLKKSVKNEEGEERPNEEKRGPKTRTGEVIRDEIFQGPKEA